MPCKHYTQLSKDERIIIANRHQNGEDYKEIARSIDRDPSTIWRELHRNGRLPRNKTTRVNKPRMDGRNFRSSLQGEAIKLTKERYWKRRSEFIHASKLVYNARKADLKARKRIKRQYLLLEQAENEELLQFVITTLDSGWSPEQIAGRVNLEGIYHHLSAKAIYKFIFKFKELDLTSYLPRHGKKYRKSSKAHYNKTKNRRTIDERPKIVDLLLRIGDLEGDTIVGKDKRDRILPHIERVSGKTAISLVLDFNAAKINKATEKDRIRVFGDSKIHTITYDNGVEFSDWHSLEQHLNEQGEDTKIYFAHPYHSWERGRSENVNGLIRRFLPKGTDFKNLTESDILMIEYMLNNRPRKRLGWLTPNEVYDACVALEGLM